MKKILFTIPVNQEIQKELKQIQGCEITFLSKEHCTDEALKDKDAVVGNIAVELLNRAPKVKWVQLSSAGADKYAQPLNKTILLTNSSGVFSQSISEHMIAGILHFYKKFDLYVEAQKQHSWKSLGSIDSITKKTVCIIGYGDIGQTFAKYMKTFDAHIIAIKRSLDNPPYADEVYTMEDVEKVLPQADIVALTLPKTPDTINLFNEKLLRLCKKDALLINVGRGDTLDTLALMKVLEEGYFKGVILDVVNPEPLPINHPLWEHPRVLITPHVSGNYNMTESYYNGIMIAKNNIERYIQGKELYNIVDRENGY